MNVYFGAPADMDIIKVDVSNRSVQQLIPGVGYSCVPKGFPKDEMVFISNPGTRYMGVWYPKKEISL